MATNEKRLKVDDGSEVKPLQDFLQWCKSVGLVLSSKVCVSKEGTVAEYGMLALDDMEEGEVVFTIPRSALLHQETTTVSVVLEKERSSLESSSGWVPLLLALLYEYTSSQSHWKPYLSLWTDFKTLDHPMFWSKEERDKLLRGTGIPEAVDTDLANIQRDYTDLVLPFIAKHPDLWNPDTHTLELYTKLVAFVMAYSYHEPEEEEDSEDDEEEKEYKEEDQEEKAPNPLMMVPMADMLNHVSNHNAILEFTPDSLKMVCVRPILKDEEVFNTYGQMANWQLLHMYGFTEPYRSNGNDTADVPVANLYKVAMQGVQSDPDRQLVEKQWEMLCQMMREKGSFVFGKQGCLTDTELQTALKMMCMSKEEFSEFKDNEGWEEDEEDENPLPFSNEDLPGLKASWKRLIHEAARLTVRSYGDVEGGQGVKSDQALMEDKAAFEGLGSRKQNALQVRCGQKSILHRLMELTQS
ncbi:N-lysine methyltransferase setd6 isoform X2 [Pseudoliparis swirei]|uniref:N-lysine methyltransferase setd6 isoform X2 n=1 Tax=Pseudoliparis swirei TaxID=2059687 RepID=UPI0024BE6D56|nr:N-lysine methyltransferase setd6 isoform X2 [Pseudoliparis swirei]